jgi:sporulation protein YlmC with PRC-barrel domain
VLLLSRETGQDVRAADGRVIGKLRDLTARLGADHPVVYRLAIGSRRRLVYLVPWTAVAAFERSEVQLRDVGPLDRFLIGRGEIPLEEDELLLVRDVLDTQIIDVVGHRLARVSDVMITRLADGRLEVAAVDVSGAAVWRRLGLRWLSKRFGGRAVDWRDLHLTSARGHDVHLATTTAAVHQLDARGLAELLTRLDLTSATEIVKAVGPVRAAGAVARTHPVVGHRIMLALEPQEAAEVLDELPREADDHYRQVVGSRTPLTGRRFRRLRGWRLRRPPATTGAADRPGRGDDRGVDR